MGAVVRASKSLLGLAAFAASVATTPHDRAWAQSPGSAIGQALQAALAHWCWAPPSTQALTLVQFPGVRFVRGSCPDEHDDLFTATVAIDADSVLYLLTSKDAFNFLVTRHPLTRALDSADVREFALLALQLSGYIGPGARLVARWQDLSEAMQDSARRSNVDPVYIGHQWGEWQLVLFTVQDGAFGPYVNRFDLWLGDSGQLNVVAHEGHWQRMSGP